MNRFIDELLTFQTPGKYGNEECIYVDENYVVVKDIEMLKADDKENVIHYTAWHKQLRSMQDLTKDYIFELNQISNAIKEYVKQQHDGFEDIDVFVHFPPQFWQFHIHFRTASLHKNAPATERFHINTVIQLILDNKLPAIVKKNMTCITCNILQRKVLYRPCKHFSCCSECSDSITHCPECNQIIDEKVYIPEKYTNNHQDSQVNL